MEPARKPGTAWSTRKPGTIPNTYVETIEGERIRITTTRGAYQESMTLSRRDARLLARRLDQCLDSTTR